ncbi:MAG: cupredoxin domain-containing protein [Solirubrobacterales bacterium]
MYRVPLLLTAAAMAVAAVLATGCGTSSDPPPKGAKTLSFKLTDEGCEPAKATVPAGATVFDVTNAGTSKVTEFEVLEGDNIVGEKEDLSDGLSGTFWITLHKGTYTLYCPGGSHERGTLTVTG